MGLIEFRDKLREASGRGQKHSMSFYENQYANQLGNAFQGRKKQREFLVFATRLFNERRYDSALRTLGGLWEECENDEDRRAVLMFTALCQSRSGDQDGAASTYRVLLRIDPENSSALSNLGHILQEKGMFQGAEEYYRRAMECDPNNPFARNNLATLYYYMGEFEQVIPHAKAALTLKGNLYQAATVLAMSYMAMGDRAEGEHWGQVAVTNGQSPEDMRNALNRAWNSRFNGAFVSESFEKFLWEWKKRTALSTNYVYVSTQRTGRSHIGGPSLGDAPLDENGKPMRQLAAIYCEEFVDSGILPRRGLLRFYIADDEVFGADFEHPNVQKNFRVLYDPVYSHLTPGVEPEDSATFPVRGCYGIRCGGPRKQAMPMNDHRFRGKFDALLAEMGMEEPSDDDMDAFCQINCPEGHRIGGYPWFTQSDPREMPGFEKYDTLLFQLDCMEFGGEQMVTIGDEGVMNFFIPKEKLEKQDFSDVLYYWDCH